MRNINDEMKKRLAEINKQFTKKIENYNKISKEILLNMVTTKTAKIRQLSNIKEKDVHILSYDKGLVGVDGSINSIGSSYPHYISILQVIAKTTKKGYDDICVEEVYTPLINKKEEWIDEIINKENLSNQEIDDRIKKAKLARLEVKAALNAAKQFSPKIIMIDGSITRYMRFGKELWQEFYDYVISNDILIVGVIEEIKTKQIYDEMQNYMDINLKDMYDREILFGILEYGQMLEFCKNKVNGIKKCFLRSSNDPHVIGMETLESQKENLYNLADLVFTLTPKGSRGIPLWLDIIDEQARISDKTMKALVETYIDPQYRKRFLSSKRENRAL